MADLAIYGGGGCVFDSSTQDMLAFDDYSFSDLLEQPSTMRETPGVVHIPTTNFSPISSSSNEPENNDFDQEKNRVKSDDDQENTTTNKQLKAKKKTPKKQREPRFAFVTKTEVDHLDDGYRWRKYGQKAVKNSPYPRSYYRCTSASCRVKKRIERSSEDPWMVVTTYEGTHTHQCPMNPPGILSKTATYGGVGSSSGGDDVDISSFISSQPHYQQQSQPFLSNQTNHYRFNNMTTNISVVQSLDSHYFQERQEYPSSMPPSFIRDHGLLQDMLSFQVNKEEPKE